MDEKKVNKCVLVSYHGYYGQNLTVSLRSRIANFLKRLLSRVRRDQ